MSITVVITAIYLILSFILMIVTAIKGEIEEVSPSKRRRAEISKSIDIFEILSWITLILLTACKILSRGLTKLTISMIAILVIMILAAIIHHKNKEAL